MPTSTVNKDTARTLREFMDYVAQFNGWDDWQSITIAAINTRESLFYQAAELYAKSCASLAWDACQRRVEYERHVQIKNREVAPDKETYLNNLFTDETRH